MQFQKFQVHEEIDTIQDDEVGYGTFRRSQMDWGWKVEIAWWSLLVALAATSCQLARSKMEVLWISFVLVALALGTQLLKEVRMSRLEMAHTRWSLTSSNGNMIYLGRGIAWSSVLRGRDSSTLAATWQCPVSTLAVPWQ